jgi:hypothetical protein
MNAARSELVAEGGPLIAEFAGNGNRRVRQLLDLGVDQRQARGRGWLLRREEQHRASSATGARHATVKLLIGNHLSIRRCANGRTPLMLAVRACVDSYWADWR